MPYPTLKSLVPLTVGLALALATSSPAFAKHHGHSVQTATTACDHVMIVSTVRHLTQALPDHRLIVRAVARGTSPGPLKSAGGLHQALQQISVNGYPNLDAFLISKGAFSSGGALASCS